MTDVLGIATVPTPQINITGLLSSTWLYIFIIGFIFLVVGIIVGIILWRRVWNKVVIVFENVAGLGFQVTQRRKARVVSLQTGGFEVLKTFGGDYVTAYGKKQGPNQYWFAKLEDGLLYNFVLADIDAKKATMDVQPVNIDVRAWYVAKDRMAKDTYGKSGFLEKYGATMIMFFFLLAFIIGMWIIVGKIGDSTKSLSDTADTNAKVAESNRDVLVALNNILHQNSNTGIVPANINLSLTGG